MMNVLFFLWIFGMTVISMLLFHSNCLDNKLIKNNNVLRVVKCVWVILIIVIIYLGVNYFFTQLIYKL